MKIVVIGANGQLGTDVCSAFRQNNDEVIELNHEEIEICDVDSLNTQLGKYKPDLIVNTAAMHNVPLCEVEPEKAFLFNATGAKNLTHAANTINSILLHISTDYVFDGAKGSPYTEDDEPHPLNVYGKTKLEGEKFIQSIAKKYFILRSCGLYGNHLCRGKQRPNFVELMLKRAEEQKEIRVVDDEILTPTSTLELARQIVKLSRSDDFGLYHTTAEGQCSWYQFTQKIFSITKTKVNLQVASSGEFAQKVNRPKYSVLENQKLKHLNMNVFKSWADGLKEYLQNRI